MIINSNENIGEPTKTRKVMNYNGKEIFEVPTAEEKYYELWGEDTFARDVFLIKIYENEGEAEARLKELEESVLDQDESIRDTFWIKETSTEEIKEREQLEEERRDQLDKQWDYDDDRLRKYVIDLVNQLMKFVRKEKIYFVWKRTTLLEKINPNEEDCYSSIALEYFKGKSSSSIGTKIKFRDGGSSSRIRVIRELHEIVPSESIYALLIKIFETDIRKAKYNRY
jgi:hypothetical protein